MTYIAVSRAMRAAAQKAREEREHNVVTANPNASTQTRVQQPNTQTRR